MPFADMPFRGEVDISSTPFVIMAYAQNASVMGENVMTNKPGWYILTAMTWGLGEDWTDQRTEAVFTPYFDPAAWTAVPLADDESIKTFCQLAQVDTAGHDCIIPQTTDIYFPPFDSSTTGTGNKIKRIEPLFLTYKNKNLIPMSLGNQTPLGCHQGDTTSTQPYDSITYIYPPAGKDVGEANYEFTLESQFNMDKTFLADGNGFAGYPYRLTNPNAHSTNESHFTSCPFRNFLENVPCTNDPNVRGMRFCNYSTYSLNNVDQKIVNFRGANYNSDGYKATEPMNWVNDQVTDKMDNFPSTTQIYIIPTQHYIYGRTSCGYYTYDISSSFDQQRFFKEIISYIYQGVYTSCDGTAALGGNCYFSNNAYCSLGIWPQYCLSPDQGCGACLGNCTQSILNLTCSPALLNTDKQPFVCGTEQPIAPTQTNTHWQMWVYGAIIILGIFLLMLAAIAFLMGSRKPT